MIIFAVHISNALPKKNASCSQFPTPPHNPSCSSVWFLSVDLSTLPFSTTSSFCCQDLVPPLPHLPPASNPPQLPCQRSALTELLVRALSGWWILESEVPLVQPPTAPTGTIYPSRSGGHCLWAQIWPSNAGLRHRGTEHLTAQPVHKQGPLGPSRPFRVQEALVDNPRRWLSHTMCNRPRWGGEQVVGDRSASS